MKNPIEIKFTEQLDPIKAAKEKRLNAKKTALGESIKECLTRIEANQEYIIALLEKMMPLKR